jgi:hypothetical protein
MDIRQLKRRDMIRWVGLHDVPYIRKILHSEITEGSLQSGMPRPNSESRGKFCDDLGSNIVVQYSVGPITTPHARITAEVWGQFG